MRHIHYHPTHHSKLQLHTNQPTLPSSSSCPGPSSGCPFPSQAAMSARRLTTRPRLPWSHYGFPPRGCASTPFVSGDPNGAQTQPTQDRTPPIRPREYPFANSVYGLWGLLGNSRFPNGSRAPFSVAANGASLVPAASLVPLDWDGLPGRGVGAQ